VPDEHKTRIRAGRRPSKDDRGHPQPESIRRNTAFALAVQLTSAVFTATLALFLVRKLSPDGYGIFALAVAVGAVATIPSDLGISASAARFIAEHRDDPSAVGVVLAQALRLKLAISASVSIALVACAGLIASAYGEPDLVWPLRAVGVAVFGQSLMLLFGAAFIAQARTSRNLRLVFGESAVEFSATVTLVLLGTGATGAAFGRAAGYAFGAFLGTVMMLRLLASARTAAPSARVPRTRTMAGYAANLAVVDWVYTSLHYLDAIVLGALLNAAAVGVFQAPFRLIAFLNYAGAALSTGVAPRMARGEGRRPNVAAFSSALRMLILIQVALFVVLLVWADPIVALLFGSDFEESGSVLRLLAPYVLFSGLAPFVSVSANYLGVARRRIPIAVAALVVNAVLDFTLIPTIGVEGAAIATSVGFAIYVPAHIHLCAKEIQLPLQPIAVTFGRALLAGAVLGGVLLALESPSLSLWAWLTGLVVGPAAYVAVLTVTRELNRDDLGHARAFAHGLAGRLGIR
jgi:O-antigen/teichoic acid export membrane protein